MSLRPPEEERFIKNALQLLKAVHYGIAKLYEQGYKNVNPNTLAMFIAVLGSDELDKHDIIRKFIGKSHLHWDKMKARDENFFIQNAAHLFDFPTNAVDAVKNLYLTKDNQGKPIMTDEFKTDIWDLLDAMIRCAIQYVYKHDGFSQIKIKDHIKTWNVKI